MKRSYLVAAAAAATLLTATAAHAGNVNWSVGISLPPIGTVVSSGPAYYPAPYYGAPSYYPEPVYYSAPAYSYYPAPVYYAPRVYAPRPRVVVAPRPYYHGGHGNGYGRGHDKYYHGQRSDWRR